MLIFLKILKDLNKNIIYFYLKNYIYFNFLPIFIHNNILIVNPNKNPATH